MQEQIQRPCGHQAFRCDAAVSRLEDLGRFHVDIRITCIQCQTPFQFVGLPIGVKIHGATMSLDGEEGRFAIVPRNTIPFPHEVE